MEKTGPFNEQTRVNAILSQSQLEYETMDLTFLKVNGQMPQAFVPKGLDLCYKWDRVKWGQMGLVFNSRVLQLCFSALVTGAETCMFFCSFLLLYLGSKLYSSVCSTPQADRFKNHLGELIPYKSQSSCAAILTQQVEVGTKIYLIKVLDAHLILPTA